MRNLNNRDDFLPGINTVHARNFTFPSTAFEAAIQSGLLSANENADNAAAKYMYMGDTMGDRHLFKHILTREYVSCSKAGNPSNN